jgi:hypothetical protein
VVKQVIAELDTKGARVLLRASMPGYGLRNLSRV